MMFEFNIGGYPGPFFHFELIRDQLHCTYTLRHDTKQQVYVIPIVGNDQWNALIAFLSTRKWKEAYENHHILDGTGWELMVKQGSLQIQSHGSNAYPPGFKKFLKLLNEVTADIGMVVY